MKNAEDFCKEVSNTRVGDYTSKMVTILRLWGLELSLKLSIISRSTWVVKFGKLRWFFGNKADFPARAGLEVRA